MLSTLSRSLEKGLYRVVVKERAGAAQGPYVLASECSGDGCPLAVPSETCVFGETLWLLATGLQASVVQTVLSASELPDALAHEQLLLAASHSPEASAQTPEQLFERIDEGLVHWLRIWDSAAAREFRAFEFRVAELSYGALFVAGRRELSARIDRGLLTGCAVPPAHCALGRTYRELRESLAYQLAESAVITPAHVAALTTLQQEQLLAAVQVAYEEVTDLASALAAVDQSQVNRLLFVEQTTGRSFAVYEYGAGDNSFGALFEEPSLEPVAHIVDGALADCRLLE